jgi:hypothetical protein
MHPVEFSFYKIIVLITAALAIGFGITNIVYFDRVRKNDDCQSISSSTATVLIWLNVILVLAAGILLIWSFIRLIFTGEKETPKINKTKNVINYPDTEITSPADLNKLEQIRSPFTSPKITPKPVFNKPFVKKDPFANVIAPGTEADIATIQKYE